MAPRKFSLETSKGQQILKDHLNCFNGGYPPIPPYGVKEHFDKHQMYTLHAKHSTFAIQCKLIAPVAHQRMPQDIFDRLFQHVDGKYPNDKRKARKVKEQLEKTGEAATLTSRASQIRLLTIWRLISKGATMTLMMSWGA